MDPNIPPGLPAPLTPVAPPPGATLARSTGATAPHSKGAGLQRAFLAAAVSAMLLVGGAVAIVSAASPGTEHLDHTDRHRPVGGRDGAIHDD